MAQATGAARNCQADTPAARATISSEDRVKSPERHDAPEQHGERQDLHRVPWRVQGSDSETLPNVASGRVAERRSSSMKSNSSTSAVSAASIDIMAKERPAPHRARG